MLGMGPAPAKGEEDYDLINAGKQPVTELPGCAFFHHADSFAMMRAATWTSACWAPSRCRSTATWPTGTGAPTRFPRWAARWTWPSAPGRVRHDGTADARRPEQAGAGLHLPLTGVRCVSRVYTDVAVFDIRADGVTVTDLFGGVTPDELRRLTGLPLKFAN